MQRPIMAHRHLDGTSQQRLIQVYFEHVPLALWGNLFLLYSLILCDWKLPEPETHVLISFDRSLPRCRRAMTGVDASSHPFSTYMPLAWGQEDREGNLDILVINSRCRVGWGKWVRGIHMCLNEINVNRNLKVLHFSVISCHGGAEFVVFLI